MDINTPAYTKFAKLLADEANLSVVIGNEKDEGKTDLTTIRMPAIPSDTRGNILWFYTLIHEIGHHVGSNKLDLLLPHKYKFGMNTPFGYVLNIVADHNSELSVYGELKGKDEYMLKGRILLMESDGLPPTDDPLAIKLQAVFIFDAMMRDRWIHHGYHYEMTPKLQVIVDNLMVLADEYTTLREGGEPNMEMAKKIWDILDMEKKAPEEEEEDNGEGDGEGNDEDNSDGDGESKEGEGEPSGGEERLKEAQKGDGKKEYREAAKKSGKKVGLSEGSTPQESISSEIEKDDGTYKKIREKEIRPKAAHKALPASSLEHRVANILKIASKVKRTGGHKRGKVNTKALSRVRTGYTTPFKQRTTKDVLDTAVTLLIDCSGSMDGRKWDTATQAAAQLANCLYTLHIPYSVLGFTEEFNGANAVTNIIFKDYGEQIVPEVIYGSMDNVNLENNCDGQSLIWAHDKLVQQKQKRKILIVLSDGLPSGRGRGYHNHLLSVCKDIDKYSKVELYGVGILTDAPSTYYKNHVLLDNLSKVEETVFNLIKETIGV